MSGIPGTLGGALAMNAGANGGTIWQHVTAVEVINQAGQITIKDDIKNVINLNSKTSTLTVNTNKQVIVNTKDTIVNASNQTTVNTKTATINASNQTSINTPTLNVSNNVNIGGNTNIGGSMNAGGAVNGSGGNCFNG